LIDSGEIDLVAMGVGENGHIAFNDPPVANFNDPETMKVVELDHSCRQQQVNDGCFQTLEEVPERAYTLTIPALMRGKRLFCMVPGPTKARAIYHMLKDPIGTFCPATILRQHPDATLYLDQESASLL